MLSLCKSDQVGSYLRAAPATPLRANRKVLVSYLLAERCALHVRTLRRYGTHEAAGRQAGKPGMHAWPVRLQAGPLAFSDTCRPKPPPPKGSPAVKRIPVCPFGQPTA